ncbi:MAG: alpha/beta hydrolase [Bacteroidota bacterium]
MKKLVFILFIFISFSVKAQINPLTSPYYANGTYAIVADSVESDTADFIAKDLLIYRPSSTVDGPYPVFIFQLGANGFGSSAINRHTYDLYMKHLASYGYVVIIIDDAAAGLPSGTSFKNTHDWFKSRVAITSHWLHQYADPNKVIIGGHSNGGVNASALIDSRPTEIEGIVYFASYPSGTFPVTHDVTTFTGKVLDLAGEEDDDSTPSACKGGYNKFTAAACKTWVLVKGMAHGGFGDYINSGQLVGTIGRDSATATVRHYLVSFLESEFKSNGAANDNFAIAAKRPRPTKEFENSCLANDLGISYIKTPRTSCELYTSTTVSGYIKNFGSQSQSNINVSYIVNLNTPVTEVYQGTINSGDSVLYTFTSKPSMSTTGLWKIKLFTSLSTDADLTNDTCTIQISNINLTLPDSVNFTGFTGANLSTVFPNWSEAQGIAPAVANSMWKNGTAFTSNTTARVNITGTSVREWMISTPFLATTNTNLYFDAALTTLNAATTYSAGMDNDDKVIVRVSTDCGTTWTDVYTIDKNSAITNTLVRKTVSLASYNGQNIKVAFFASSTASGSNTYDFHLDNIMLKNDISTDISLLEMPSPAVTSCYGTTESIQVKVKNLGINTINLATNNLAIHIQVSGQTTAVIDTTINQGTIAAGATQTITVKPVFSMSSNGNYIFAISTNFADGNLSNNTLSPVTITVNNPIITIQGLASLCNGQKDTLRVSYNKKPSVYNWSNGTHDTVLIVNPSVNSTYSLTISDANSCTASDDFNITINELPVANAGSDVSICKGDSATIGSTSIGTIAWSPNTSITNINIQNPKVSPITSTSYLMTATNQCGTSTDNVYIHIYELPAINFVTDAQQNQICKGNSVKIEANGADSLVWSNGSSDSIINVMPLVTTTYSVTATSVNNCIATDDIEIIVNEPASIVSSPSPSSVCLGECINLSVSGAANYTWSTGSNASTITICPQSDSTYKVTCIDSHSCITEVSFVINVNENPTIDLGSDTITVALPHIIDAGSGYASYTWSDQTHAQTTTANSIGWYYITITNADGCLAVDSVYVDLFVNTNDIENSGINFYPNPANKIVTINFNQNQSSIVEIYDVKGILIRKEEFRNKTNCTMDISDLSPSIYIVNIIGTTSTKTIRLVKN